jgi:hypothetical protein
MSAGSVASPVRAVLTLLAGLIALPAVAAGTEALRIHAITGARIVVAPGRVIERGTIVLRDGLIEAVGSRVAVPADAKVIEAGSGWTVYPAFIDAAASVALDTEAAAGAPRGPAVPKRLGARHELKAVHPEDGVVDRLDGAHASVEGHRALGFAVAHVLPDKGVFRGESALIALRKAPAPQIVLQPHLAQVTALESASFMAREYPSSKFGAVATVRQALLDAQRQAVWAERFAAHPAGMAAPDYYSSDAPLLALLRGERIPLFVAVNGLDPGRFGHLAQEFGLRGSVTLARGLGDRAADLAAARMPVLLPLELPAKPQLAGDDDLLETGLQQLQESLLAPKLPAALDAAGVEVAFVTLGMKSPRAFTENLAAIVKAGYPADKALAAVTTRPAALLGLTRALGTLEAGKQANLLVVDGELFSPKPKLRHLFVSGFHEEIEEKRAVGDPAAVVDPRGTWKILTDAMGRSSESTWVITATTGADGRRQYAGSSEGARGKRDFSRVEVTGNAMTVVSAGQGGEIETTVVVTGDTLSGEATAQSGRGAMQMKISGQRVGSPEEGVK